MKAIFPPNAERLVCRVGEWPKIPRGFANKKGGRKAAPS